MDKDVKFKTTKQTLATDVVSGGIIVAAILMFVGTGSLVLPQVVKAVYGDGTGPDNLIATAMLLNIALILFGWNRYRELAKEVVHRREAEEVATALAITDPLTKCLNRRTLSERTADMIAKADGMGKKVAFLMLDLDNFKNINDVQGHEAGDLVLIEVAARMQKVMPPNALVARLGGDEFACAFIFDPTASQLVERICEDIIDCVSRPIKGPQTIFTVTTSIGIDTNNHGGDTVDAIMRRADIAMYFSKKNGRNCLTWFEQSMEDEVQTRNRIEAAMRQGIGKGEFVPYYEKQIDLQTGKLIGFEVLARWKSDLMGEVGPEIFIPIAEETGLISDLSEGVIEQAMIDARNWDSSLTISVNVSPIQLRDPWLAQKIVKLLVRTGFPANRLEVEITETSLFENVDLAKSIIGSLKNQGVRIALDDFGTGYSSLAHLRALPFDRIKIDRSFITSIKHNPESAAIVQAITSLGASMNLPITAEGIENQSIVDHLCEIGCMKGQGFFYGQPQTAGSTRKMLAEHNMLDTVQADIQHDMDKRDQADIIRNAPLSVSAKIAAQGGRK